MKPIKQQNLLVGMLFLFPFVLLACITILLFTSHRDMDASFKWVAHTNEVNARIQNLLKNLLDIETGQGGYLLTGRVDYLEPYEIALKNIYDEFESLRTLTRDNPIQQEYLSRLQPHIDQRLEIAARAISLKKEGRASEALRLILSGEGKQSMNEIRNLISGMTEHEGDLLRKRELAANSQARFSHHLAISLMLLDTLALASIAYMLKRMQSLNRMVIVCAWSKTIKSNGRWISFEAYLKEQFGLSVSHGISKEVYEKLMNEPDPPSES